MYSRSQRTARRIVTLGVVLATTMVLFGGIPVSEASHEATACGNDAVGEPLLLECRNEVGHTTKITMEEFGTALALESRAGDRGAIALRAIANDHAIHAEGSTGVFGTGFIGLHGTGRTGVRAQSSTGTALHVLGKATFTRSGKTSIGSGLTQKPVSLGNLSTATIVTATLLGAPLSGLTVASVQVQPNMTRFIIHLNQAVPAGKTAVVGWFVVN